MRIWAAVACTALATGLCHDACADALHLTWNDCASSPTATAFLAPACPTDQTHALVAAFELTLPADSVIGLEAVVDIQVAPDSLPAWWQYAPAGCRYGRLVASADFSGAFSCSEFWGGEANLDGPPVYIVRSPRGGANQARIMASFAVPSSSFRALQPATRYYGVRLEFRSDLTECEGCEASACLVLNEIRLVRLPGTMPPSVSIQTPGPGDANRVTWQSGTANCAAVPVRRSTWGRLKSLYR